MKPIALEDEKITWDEQALTKVLVLLTEFAMAKRRALVFRPGITAELDFFAGMSQNESPAVRGKDTKP